MEYVGHMLAVADAHAFLDCKALLVQIDVLRNGFWGSLEIRALIMCVSRRRWSFCPLFLDRSSNPTLGGNPVHFCTFTSPSAIPLYAIHNGESRWHSATHFM